jgi:drug/metabolite transporter (DMT)-like permease
MRAHMTERQKGIIALVIVLLAWSLSSVFVKYLIREGYDAHTQNFYRYLAATLAVLPFLVRRVRRDGVQLNRRLLWLLLLTTLPNLSHQISWTISLNWINPGLASFLNKSSVLFAAVLAFLLFPDERWLFRSGRFLTGLTLTILGTAGLALMRGDVGDLKANLGVVLVLIAALSWAVYSVAAKRPTAEVGSPVAFGVVGIYTTIACFFVALQWGDLSRWSRTPWHVNVIMIGSGILCIGIAHTLYYYAMRVLTVSVCATMLLTTPLGTLLISRWLFKEQMTSGQLLSAVLLMAGGFLTLLAKKGQTPPEVAQAAESADA